MLEERRPIAISVQHAAGSKRVPELHSTLFKCLEQRVGASAHLVGALRCVKGDHLQEHDMPSIVENQVRHDRYPRAHEQHHRHFRAGPQWHVGANSVLVPRLSPEAIAVRSQRRKRAVDPPNLLLDADEELMPHGARQR